MFAILALGFIMGLQHATEADHVAAVATIASRHSNTGDIVRHGLTWGLGHTLTLLALAGAALLLGSAIPDSLAELLEFCVGIMLVLLGAHVLWRIRRDSIHIHVHQHHDGPAHLHVHGHAGEQAPHEKSAHAHVHKGFRWRTLLVGFMHGMAGSAALLLLAMTKVRDPVRGVAYILVFGVGSMIGMGVLSALISVPLALSAKFITWANRGLQVSIGVGTLCLGVTAIFAHMPQR